MALLNVKSEAPLGRGTACCSLIMHFRYFSVKWRNGSLLWPQDSVLCVVPLHVLSFAESIIFCCSQTARGLIVMVMTRPSSAGRALHTLAHNDSAVLVFKRWSAAGRRPSPGVSCSCGNLCHGTIEREPRTLTGRMEGPHTATMGVHRYQLMKSLHWRVNK